MKFAAALFLGFFAGYVVTRWNVRVGALVAGTLLMATFVLFMVHVYRATTCDD